MQSFTLGLLLFCAPMSAAPPVMTAIARVHFVAWEVVTSTAMLPSEVRHQAHISTVIKEQAAIAELIAFIHRDRMVSNPDSGVYDVRLVIDLESMEGEVSTFIASRLALSEEGTPETNRPIDGSFRSAFERWIKQKANQSAQHNEIAEHFSVFESRSSRG